MKNQYLMLDTDEATTIKIKDIFFRKLKDKANHVDVCNLGVVQQGNFTVVHAEIFHMMVFIDKFYGVAKFNPTDSRRIDTGINLAYSRMLTNFLEVYNFERA